MLGVWPRVEIARVAALGAVMKRGVIAHRSACCALPADIAGDQVTDESGAAAVVACGLEVEVIDEGVEHLEGGSAGAVAWRDWGEGDVGCVAVAVGDHQAPEIRGP